MTLKTSLGRALVASMACSLLVPLVTSAPAEAAASTGVPTRAAGYWWSDAESRATLTSARGRANSAAEWTSWGVGNTHEYGVPALVSARSEGIAAPPAGDRVVRLRHSGPRSRFGSDQGPGAHNMHKLYKQFTAKNWPSGAEPANRNDGTPSNVSGRYITYLYLRSDQMALAPRYWTNLVQFKEDYLDVNNRFVSNPSYWLGFNSDNPARPVLNLSSWGGRHKGPRVDVRPYFDRWTKVEMRVYQGNRLEVYLNDKLFDTALNSEYPVGRMNYAGRAGSSRTIVARPLGWTFGAGNYNNGGDVPAGASGVYVDLSCVLPLP